MGAPGEFCPDGQQPAMPVAVWELWVSAPAVSGKHQEGQSQGPGLQPRSVLSCVSSFLQSLKDLDGSIFDLLSLLPDHPFAQWHLRLDTNSHC